MARIAYPVEPSGAIVDRVVAERGSLLNLYRMLLHNPGLAEGWLRLGTAVVAELTVDHRTRELVTMAVAASCGATYEWDHHIAPATAQGIDAGQLDALRRGDDRPFDERDRSVLAAVDVIGRDPARASTALAALTAWFDDAAICELAVLIGFYWMVTRVTIALDIEDES